MPNLFFFSCNIEAGVPDRQERICPDVVRAGVTAVVVVCFIVVFGALFGVFFFLLFHSATSKWATRVGFNFVRTRALQAVCAVTAYSGS